MNKIRIQKVRVDSHLLASIGVFLFFARYFVSTVAAGVLPFFSTLASIILVYGFAFAACMMNPKKYIKFDFIVLFAGTVAFFLTTMLFHPEYVPFYNRAEYGVWDYVFEPFRGIYAYYFVRLIDDEEEFGRIVRKSGWLMILYFLYNYYKFLQRGYWYGVGMGLENASIHMSYSVSFGYRILPFALVYLYYTFKEKKISDLVAAITCIVLILIAGSRGPVLFIGLFLVLYIIINLPGSNRKWLTIALITLASVLLYLFYDVLILLLINILSAFGLSSRFLTKLLNGSISSDSGRSILWRMALDMIRENPWGYGFMGSRHVIGKEIIAGYPHSIILEMLIDFGVIIGSIFVIAILIGSMNILFNKKNRQWRDLYLVFFCCACSLLMSLSFWSDQAFWICLGIAVNRHYSIKRSKRAMALPQKNQE